MSEAVAPAPIAEYEGATRGRVGLLARNAATKKLRAGLPKGWRVGDKTGKNGSDAAGDLAIAWPQGTGPIAICAYVQGGRPTPEHQDALFAVLGRIVENSLA